MRVVIIGQKWLGAEVLKLCVSRGDDVALVVTPPEADRDRLWLHARSLGIPTLAGLKRLDAVHIPEGVDLILAAHAHLFITRQARECSLLGAAGYHPSLLPRHRGRDAIKWAIHMREPITGGTVYWMDDGADTGPIAMQESRHIRPDDDAVSLWRRELAPLGLELFARVLADLDRGIISAEAQDASLATWEPGFHSKRLAD